VIPRYSLPEMAALFGDEARFSLWLEIEVLAVEALADLGVVPREHALALREHAPIVDAAFIQKVQEREQVTDHDVAAFVDVVQQEIGFPAGAYLHYGLTSSDVVDTALSLTIVRAAGLLLGAAWDLVGTIARRSREFASTPMIGRTHGMHAEPTTFGAKLALFGLGIARAAGRLARARDALSVGKLSGAVGTYSNLDPTVEREVCRRLGLRAIPATQVIPRDLHAEYLWSCASMGTAVEALATEIRHLQRTEVSEVEEPFSAGQKGSSAMPHKRNPITSERLCGLARLLRGYLQAGLEDVALWHERDISHSSVERVVVPDASMITYYVLRRMNSLIDQLVVHPDQMMANLMTSRGVFFSQSVLLALISGGQSRDEAYRIVQAASRRASLEGISLEDALRSEPDAASLLKEGEDLFDVQRLLRNATRPVETLEAVLRQHLGEGRGDDLGEGWGQCQGVSPEGRSLDG